MKNFLNHQRGQSLLETLILIPMVVFALFALLELILNLHLYFIADSLGFDFLVCKNAIHVNGSSSQCENKTLLPLKKIYKNKIIRQLGSKEIHFKISSNLLPAYHWRKKYDP